MFCHSYHTRNDTLPSQYMVLIFCRGFLWSMSEKSCPDDGGILLDLFRLKCLCFKQSRNLLPCSLGQQFSVPALTLTHTHTHFDPVSVSPNLNILSSSTICIHSSPFNYISPALISLPVNWLCMCTE